MAAPLPPTIQSLAQQLGPRKGVLWATESSKLVGTKTQPADQAAAQAAEAWVKNPNPSTQAMAAAAAKKTDFQGPGAWAAQAASWAHPSAHGVASGAGVTGANRQASAPVAGVNSPPAGHAGNSAATASLVAGAVAGSVSIAAALAAGAKPPMQKASVAPAAPTAPSRPGIPGLPKIPTLPKIPVVPPPTPAEAAKIAKIQKPFIDLGTKILLDKSLFAAR
jgi:hypothetical protein